MSMFTVMKVRCFRFRLSPHTLSVQPMEHQYLSTHSAIAEFSFCLQALESLDDRSQHTVVVLVFVSDAAISTEITMFSFLKQINLVLINARYVQKTRDGDMHESPTCMSLNAF